MSLESINLDHMEEKFDEDTKDQRKIEIIGIDEIIVLEETIVNIMSQQVMKIFTNHDYIALESLDYTLNGFVTLEPNFIDMMTQHKIIFFVM
jgi:hypothetical protein